jgi:hypothetical protein
MKSQHVFIIVVIAVVCFVAGYWLAFPAKKAVAPEAGVPVSVISIRDTSSSQIYRVTGEYPQLGNVSSSFNAAIANYVNSNLAQFQKDSDANWQARIDTMPSGTKNTLPAQSFAFSSAWTPEQINDRYISIIVRLEYFNGGANETQLLKTFNYDVTAGKIMTLADLFPNVPTFLKQISSLSIDQLTSSLQQSGGASLNSFAKNMLQSGAVPTTDNYANFTFNDDVVTIYFPKYQVAPGSFGEQQVGIVRATID